MFINPSLEVLRDQFLEDVSKNTKDADEMLLMYLNASYELGKTAALRAIELEVENIIASREDDDDDDE